MTVEGVLTQVDIGMGVLELCTEDGRRYQIIGPVSPEWVGARVRIVGQERALHGFGMTGAEGIIEVASVSAVR